MERNANYFLVGLISLILVAVAAIFIAWLANLQFNRDYGFYNISFVGPVRGLSDGGEVHFNGIKVGEVIKISLDPKDTSRVIARARVTSILEPEKYVAARRPVRCRSSAWTPDGRTCSRV